MDKDTNKCFTTKRKECEGESATGKYFASHKERECFDANLFESIDALDSSLSQDDCKLEVNKHSF